MIRGRYLARIEIDVKIDENDPELLPFDEIERRFKQELTPFLERLIGNEVCYDHVGTVNIEEQYVNVWKEDDDAAT